MGQHTSEGPADPGRRAFLEALGIIAAASGSAVGAIALLGSTRTDATPTVPNGLAEVSDGIAGPTTTSEPSPTTAASSTTTTTKPALEASRLEVVSKSGWGARDTGSFDSHVPERLTCHHTASSGSDPGGAPARIRGYQRYHQGQGWPEGHFLPCLDGNFDVATPSARSIDALVLVLAWGSQTHDIDPRTLSGHRDVASTTCPGANLYALRDEIERRVVELVATGRPVELALVDPIT